MRLPKSRLIAQLHSTAPTIFTTVFLASLIINSGRTSNSDTIRYRYTLSMHRARHHLLKLDSETHFDESVAAGTRIYSMAGQSRHLDWL